LLLVSLFFVNGCAYTDIQIPMDKNFNKTQLASKEGEASTYTVLYLVSWGDSGSRAAADNGNITQINHADKQIYSVLFGLYTRITTVVYGE